MILRELVYDKAHDEIKIMNTRAERVRPMIDIKRERIKHLILLNSKDFGGEYKISEILELANITEEEYYSYKEEIEFLNKIDEIEAENRLKEKRGIINE